MDHPAIEVRVVPGLGQGMFATRTILAGEILWAEDPEDPRYHVREISAWPPDEQAFFLRWSYQIDDEWFAGPRRPDEVVDSDHMNHGCDPNAWWDDQRTISARRDILPGEQITFDYVTSESRPEYVFACQCGAETCRTVVRGEDFLRSPELQSRYGTHAQPFLLRRLARLEEVETLLPPLRDFALSYLHDAIEVRPSPTAGFGLFAMRAIEEGELVWQGDRDEPLVHRSTLAVMSPEQLDYFQHFACQIDEEWYSVPPADAHPEPADYMNHSCDPTVWYVDAWTMVSRRRIEPGEEITYDYATSESSPGFKLDPCRCGAWCCRGVVGPSDYVDSPELQARYGEHVLPYLRRRAAAQAARATV